MQLERSAAHLSCVPHHVERGNKRRGGGVIELEVLIHNQAHGTTWIKGYKDVVKKEKKNANTSKKAAI